MAKKRRKQRAPAKQLRQVQSELAREEAQTAIAETRLRRHVLEQRENALTDVTDLTISRSAESNRTNREWRSKKLSAYQELHPDLGILNARSREAVRDIWIAGSGVDAYRRGIVGIGITPRSVAKDPMTHEPFEEFNRGLDQWFTWWMRDPRFVDSEKRKTFVGYEDVTVAEWKTVGESITILSYVPRPDMVGLVLQMCEPEQLDTLLTKYAPTGNEVRDGIEIDKFGAAVAYHLHCEKHPFEKWSTDATRIEADRVIHLFRPDRVRQHRGMGKLRRVLTKILQLGMYDQYQLVAAKMEACHGGSIEAEPQYDNENLMSLNLESGDDGTDAFGSTKIVWEPGMMPRMNPGEKVNWHTPSRPGGSYDPFTKAQVGQIAAGIGLDYATVARDYSQGNFSSQRQGKLETDKEMAGDQQLMIDVWCRRVREAFKEFAILEGRVSAPGFFQDPLLHRAYLEDEWQPPPNPWIDPVKSAKGIILALEYGLTTRAAELGKLGLFYEDVIDQQAVERQRAAEKGVFLPDAQPKQEAAGLSAADDVLEAILVKQFGPRMAAFLMEKDEEEEE